VSDQLSLDYDGNDRSETFEQGFERAARGAASVAKVGTQLTGAAREMQKAAAEGDIVKIRKALIRLGAATDMARQELANAKGAWPFSDEAQQEYMSSRYSAELISEAANIGLRLYERDGHLLAYPSVIRVLPSDLAVRIDKKKVTAIRPSHLAKALLANQSKKPEYSAEKVVEGFESAYNLIVPPDRRGAVAKLTEIYQSLTLRPGSARDYDKSDFARDVFLVDQSGVLHTRAGSRIAFPASTATRGGKSDLITFVAPSGEITTYYGIRFTQDDRS
jgi:hypothetical protein